MKAKPLFRFVHCADLHLDSPFRGIQTLDPNVASILREATFKSFSNIVDLAVSSHADFLIIAGDVYNQANRSLHAQLKFREILQKATDNGLQCFICHGNHDPLSGWEADIKFPEAVHRFGYDDVEKFAFRRGDEILANVYGISFPESAVQENLSQKFKKDIGSPFSIGVLHCNLGGDPAHDNYAPCTMGDLSNTGMDYWALGHIHVTRIINQKNPCIIYPGCVQGLDILESGAHGCYLIDVKDDGDIDIKFRETDVVRWFIKEVDVSTLNTLDELLNTLTQSCQETTALADGRTSLLRFNLLGRSPLHNQLQNHIDPERDIAVPLRDNSDDGMAWIESVQVNTHPMIDITSRRKVDDSVGDFLKAADNLRNQENSDELIRQLLRGQAPKLIDSQIDSLATSDIAEIRDAVEWLGLDKLAPEE